jgi:hypothetical protein
MAFSHLGVKANEHIAARKQATASHRDKSMVSIHYGEWPLAGHSHKDHGFKKLPFAVQLGDLFYSRSVRVFVIRREVRSHDQF